MVGWPDEVNHAYKASWVGSAPQKGPHWIALTSRRTLSGVEPGSDLNEQTKECVELIPRVFRVTGGEKPTSLSQSLEIEATDTNDDIKYDRDKDEIYRSSARST